MASCSACAPRIEREEAGSDCSTREHFLAGTVVKLESLIKECDFVSLSFLRLLKN